MPVGKHSLLRPWQNGDQGPAVHAVKAKVPACDMAPALTATGAVARLDGEQSGVPAMPGINACALTL
jgi:hypothetical protein